MLRFQQIALTASALAVLPVLPALAQTAPYSQPYAGQSYTAPAYNAPASNAPAPAQPQPAHYTSSGNAGGGYNGTGEDWYKVPDTIDFGLGYEDFDKQESHKRSANFRADYVWGISLLPLISPWFNGAEHYVQFHPFAGVETTTLGSLWAGGGWSTDFFIYKHGVITWSEGVGLYEPGNMSSLHGTAEFRSMIEGGWIFDNKTRLLAQASHESDAGLTKRNPGEETVGLYYNVPLDIILGKQPF